MPEITAKSKNDSLGQRSESFPRRDFLQKAGIGLLAAATLTPTTDTFTPSPATTALHAAELVTGEPKTVKEVVDAFVSHGIISHEEAKTLEPKLRLSTTAKVPVGADYSAEQVPSLIYRDINRTTRYGILNLSDVRFLLNQNSMTKVSDLLCDIKNFHVTSGKDPVKTKDHYQKILIPKYFADSVASVSK